MTTLNLSRVTMTLQNLLRANVRRLLGGGSASDPEITLMPPELVEATTRTLNLHLYHVAEDPLHRNAVAMAGGVPPISAQPMALRLFYVMTAHLTRNNAFDAEAQQHLMGLGMKTFHDHPVIDDGLVILPTPASPPVPVMHADLLGGGNRIEIVPRNLEPEENLNFWAAEDQKTPRMSAYYEVRTIFLSPEEVRGASGTVYDVGLYVTAAAVARLRGSRSVLGFTMPAATGLGAQAIDVTPARTTLQAAAVPDRARVRLVGENLTTGEARTLRIAQGGVEHIVDPALNPDWDVRFASDEISLIPQAVLQVDDGAGGATPVAIAPGMVRFSLTIAQHRFAGLQRLSVETPAGSVEVALGAHVETITGPVDEAFTLAVDPVVDLSAASEVALAVGGQWLDRTSPDPDGPGTFSVGASEVVFAPPGPAPFTGTHPVQLFVDGAESQPVWLEVP